MAAYSLKRAQSLAQVASLTYASSAYRPVGELSLRERTNFSVGQLSGFVARCDRTVVVALRGTPLPSDPELFWDFVRCFDASLDFEQVPAEWGRAHRGFLRAADSLVSIVKPILRTFGASFPVYVTGHSLGGAVAKLLAMRLWRSAISVAGVYTYGAPRVGDKRLGEMLSYFVPVFRHEVGYDIVPHLPLSPGVAEYVARQLPVSLRHKLVSTEYKHVGRLIYFPPAWSGQGFGFGRITRQSASLDKEREEGLRNAPRADFLGHHSVVQYVNVLLRAV